MLNKLRSFLRRYALLEPGDRVICAVSGGADSMALLFALYLLRQKLQIRLEAAHFNHQLRGTESDRDEAFVRDFCHRFDIPLHVGRAHVQPGKKGLEAAARDARYSYFDTLPGKLATAHTANDNAETVLMHLIRGTGLKGLGGIAPVSGRRIRPMLEVTRQEVLDFLAEYHILYIEDSSNQSDDFLRNRLRHHVMPLLTEENPSLAENMSAMALRLRQDEQALSREAEEHYSLNIHALRKQSGAVRRRVLECFLRDADVREPEASHLELVEALIFSDNPSARADLPGGVTVSRCYDCLTVQRQEPPLQPVKLRCPGTTQIPELKLCVICEQAGKGIVPRGELILRCRRPGDEITLPGGTKSVKKLFIDRKIPAGQRLRVPVIADDAGVVAVQHLGMNLARVEEAGFQIRFEQTDNMGGFEHA